MAAGTVIGIFSRTAWAKWLGKKWEPGLFTAPFSLTFRAPLFSRFFLAFHLYKGMFSANTRYLVAVGWCASFTTYSTFSWDTFRYIQEGNIKLAAANVAFTLLGCLGATWAGVLVAKTL